MIRIEFTGEDLGDVTSQIENFLNQTSGTVGISQSVNTSNAAPGKKAAAAPPKTPPPAKKIDLDQLRETLAPVGSPAQKKQLIASFMNDKGTPATKFSELKEEDYPAVLEAIKELEESLNL